MGQTRQTSQTLLLLISPVMVIGSSNSTAVFGVDLDEEQRNVMLMAALAGLGVVVPKKS